MKIILLIATIAISQLALAQNKKLHLYLDADFSNHASSAQAIEMGIETALSEVDNVIQGYKLSLLLKDHRSNSLRSKRHMDQFLADQNALFMYGGMHSPPYIKYREFINKQGILLFVPWAAGAPITRYDQGTNWVFRLSLDDSKAGIKLADYALDKKNCQQTNLLLEDTSWGRSNFKVLTSEFAKASAPEPDVIWFKWNIQSNSIKKLIRDITANEPDCVLFVGNNVEGVPILTELANFAQDNDLKVNLISHWGITGGNFEKQVNHQLRQAINLSLIQTCFSFHSKSLSDFHKSVFNKAQRLYPDRLNTVSDLTAPAGFIHGYDLTRLIIKALRDIELTDNMVTNRTRLRDAMEQIDGPIQGLIKTYKKPFSPFSLDNLDAHEALGLDDFCMASYDENNNLQLIAE